jgi:hypothetical protein
VEFNGEAIIRNQVPWFLRIRESTNECSERGWLAEFFSRRSQQIGLLQFDEKSCCPDRSRRPREAQDLLPRSRSVEEPEQGQKIFADSSARKAQDSRTADQDCITLAGDYRPNP